LKGPGRLALDTNAVIAYREGISYVCNLVDEAEVVIVPVTVLGELLYGAFNSAKSKKNELVVRKFAR
jgi:tRNA(fMet)-specific endonuclease VapC